MLAIEALPPESAGRGSILKILPAGLRSFVFGFIWIVA
jgi:hypothetical protein